MSRTAAFLVVLDEHAHPEQAEATMAAVMQLKGVVGIRSTFDDVGQEIQRVRGWRDEARAAVTVDRYRRAITA